MDNITLVEKILGHSLFSSYTAKTKSDDFGALRIPFLNKIVYKIKRESFISLQI